jgi:hypothetical protein
MLLFDNTIFKIKLNYQLSYVLIPLSVILYVYFPIFRSYLLFHMVCVGIIGTIDSILNYLSKNLGIIFAITSVIIHLALLLVLINFKKYGKINSISVLLLIIANLTIFFLPFWPYNITKEHMIILYNFIYFCLYIASLLIY